MENSAQRSLMRKCVFFSALGVSVIAGSLATATPAHATLWRNFKYSNSNTPLYLKSGSLQEGLAIMPYGNVTNFIWSQSPDPVGSGYWRLVPSQQPPGKTVVAGVWNGDMTEGFPVVTEPENGTFSQH